MTRLQMIANIRRARALAREVYDATELPQLQLILRHADQNLHWALWNLGQIDELRPDLPGSIVAPERSAKRIQRQSRRGALRAPSRRGKRSSR
ncbi:MAG TPA: hypothetical protein VIF14_15755 [Alphaproteobacteria bacterium]|jgi:hypothetical protein